MDIPIVFEDDVLLIINKPPGLVVNRAESVKVETVQDWAEEKFSNSQIFKLSNEHTDFVSRAGIVHRIDKETSGLLIIAKTPQAFAELQRQFKERLIHKTYLALAHGKVVPEEGEIRAPVGRLPWNRERFGIVPGGKDSVTKYKVTSVIPAPELGSRERKEWIPGQARNDKAEDISLVELYPETGRTHQIRVHMKYINHPLVGDYLYAGRKTSRDDREWAPRCMLHAWKLQLFHPTSNKMLAFEAPIPDDMNTIVQ